MYQNLCFYLVNIYIPPDVDNNELDNFLSNLSFYLSGKLLIIMGDFNSRISNLNIPATDPRSVAIQSFIFTLNLNQYNTVCNSNKRMLDLVFTNIDCDVIVEHDLLPVVREDEHHPALFITLHLKSTRKLPEFPHNINKRYNFKKADLCKLYTHIGRID